jgi:four helix bundle protein
MINTFKDLIAWQKAHQLVLLIYKESNTFPTDERFGLTSQFRRAAVSIAANIAEGFKKRSIKEKLHYYNISQSSLEEVRYYIILSNDLGYHKNNEISEKADEVGRLIDAMYQSLEKFSKKDKM